MLVSFTRTALNDTPWQSPLFVRWSRWVGVLVASRYTLWLLWGLGILRVGVFLLAYPPAHGADSADYFLYAAQFDGLDAPIVFELIYPFYPLLIYLTHYWLGNIYLLIGLQLLFSSLQGVVFYAGLRPYSPTLAFLVALMVRGDAQTGILYNFTSTEPLYMFLLSVSFSGFLIALKRRKAKGISAVDVGLGVVLAVTLLARPVGRYLIVPFGVLFLLGTRSWRRTGVLVASYSLALVIFMGFNQIVFDRFELNGGGSFMLARPLIRSGLLEADNGPASAELLRMQAGCAEGENLSHCLVAQVGDWPTVRALYSDAFREMLLAHPLDFAGRVWDAFHRFLRKPGLQYRGAVTPSDVQCTDIDAIVDRNTQIYLEKDWLLYGASDLTADRLRPIVRDITTAMCPPWPDSDTVREGVDTLAFRYRSLSRPHPLVWYGLVALAVILIPWARRFVMVVLIAGAVVANHAAASAVVLNVQPRYIAVVNSYKGVLLLVLLFVMIRLGLRLVDGWLARSGRGATRVR